MRYWIIACSALLGIVSLFRTGDPSRVFASLVIGAGSGVILYGLFVVLTSAGSSASNYFNKRSVQMNKFLWAVIFFVAVVVQAAQSNFLFALGSTTPWYIVGLVFSPIWWGVTKKNRKSPWQWFDWLNAGAYIMIILFVLNIAVKSYMSSKGIG